MQDFPPQAAATYELAVAQTLPTIAETPRRSRSLPVVTYQPTKADSETFNRWLAETFGLFLKDAVAVATEALEAAGPIRVRALDGKGRPHSISIEFAGGRVTCDLGQA